jgi:predicted ATPase
MRADLPSGTVTFLFTDVEGSTKLLHELGADAYAGALAEHRRIIREACETSGGVEVDTQGDAFFFAFPTAPGAIAAASAMTDALATGPIRARAGLHTGTPLLAGEGYIGDDVHRAARIAAAGHGGQVLVSSTTAGLVDLELIDLGEHRLKDLSASERIYQLGQVTFPPLKSLYRTNLPVPATSFLGRDRELAEVTELLQDGARLLTLTGPGGTGKTRLAVQAAAEAAESFPDGIWWIPLASLRDVHLLVSTVAQTLTVEEEPGRELAESVATRLSGKQTLLILDNAEHLMPQVVTDIAGLRDIAGPTLLVTSRERLQLQGEHVYSVPSLAQQDGVELFLARARSLDSSIEESEAVVELCERLDNLPLALELAAARTAVFSPEQLVERLSQRLDLLKAGRDADPRQQTLRATVEWSYDLLEPEEQRLFCALSVFVGGCTYEAAEAVCDAEPDTLQSLLDKSLLRRREELGRARYWMLETIRELATERLVAESETDDLHRVHAEHYLDVARSANLASDVDGLMRHDLVIPERDNMRAGLAWALETDERELGLELVIALENYWATTSPDEGGEWAEALLDGATIEDGLVVRALRVEGGMANIAGRLDHAEQLWEQALEIARSIGDEKQEAILLHRLASVAAQRQDWASVQSFAEPSLAGHRRVGFPKGEAQALTSLAEVSAAEGDLERALALLHESHDLCVPTGFRWWQAGTLARMGVLLLRLGRLGEAELRAREALSISHSMHDRHAIAYELRLLAAIAASSGDARRAGVLLGALDAEAARAPLGFWLHGAVPIEQSLTDADLEFAAGQSAGRAMELSDAVAFALEATSPDRSP